MDCSKCGYEMQPGANFCMGCGVPTHIATAVPITNTGNNTFATTFCHACGCQAKATDTFCPNCGGLIQAPQQLAPAIMNQKQSQKFKSKPTQSVIGCLVLIVAAIIIGALLDSGSDKKFPTEPTTEQTAQTETATEPAAEQENDDLLEMGQTFTTDVWKVTLNGAWITDSVSEKPYMDLKPEAGSLFIRVDITFENITKDTKPFSSMFDQFKISTDDGYSFDEDIMGRASLKTPFEEGNILPGKKRRGNLIFRVNDNVKDAMFEIRFTSVTARWKLYGEKTKGKTFKEMTSNK